MSDWGLTTNPQRIAGFLAVAVLLLLDLAFSVVMLSSRALSRVSLRKLSNDAVSDTANFEALKEPGNRQVAAAGMLRQFCLLGSSLILIAIAAGYDWPVPAILGIVVVALVGVILIETTLARAIAVWNPRAALKLTSSILRVSDGVMYPVVAVLSPLLRWVGRNQRISDEQRDEEQDEEVEALIEVGERAGLLEANESEMMRGIVDLDETPVREIMTPRTDIVALPVYTTVVEARKTILQAGHSRLPVYRDSVDNVVGILHSRDLFTAWEEKTEDESVSRYLRSATFVPESLSAGNLLTEMRQRSHLAIVVDEYGGVAGLVTLEDLLEEIVGEIRDEHEDEEEPVRKEADGIYIINAATHVGELETLFGIEFEDRAFDTVGGFVVFGFGRVPSAGEILDIKGLRVEVLQAERRRVHRVRISRLHEPEEARA